MPVLSSLICSTEATFSGLPQGTRAVLQVLYFTPSIRNAMLATVPDPEKEFCLTDEMSLLFRMLVNARGAVCQASNLFR